MAVRAGVVAGAPDRRDVAWRQPVCVDPQPGPVRPPAAAAHRDVVQPRACHQRKAPQLGRGVMAHHRAPHVQPGERGPRPDRGCHRRQRRSAEDVDAALQGSAPRSTDGGTPVRRIHAGQQRGLAGDDAAVRGGDLPETGLVIGSRHRATVGPTVGTATGRAGSLWTTLPAVDNRSNG
ncbi:MAG TPA: hypothetical protein VLJ59_04640 [Mycobacteriales bacterium]|nr:hypothetical protein [Mycobacteriales bacterium]